MPTFTLDDVVEQTCQHYPSIMLRALIWVWYFARLGNAPLAVEAYQKAIAINPNDLAARSNLAYGLENVNHQRRFNNMFTH